MYFVNGAIKIMARMLLSERRFNKSYAIECVEELISSYDFGYPMWKINVGSSLIMKHGIVGCYSGSLRRTSTFYA